MNYLKDIWNFIKYLIAPVIAYIKGSNDGRVKEENKILKAENEFLRGHVDRVEKIIAKYDAIRERIRLSQDSADKGGK